MTWDEYEFPDCNVCGRPDCTGCVCAECGDGPNAHDVDCPTLPRDRFGRLLL